MASFMEYMIDQSGHRGGTYIEAFAGGAGVAIDLLLRDVVSLIVINDYDKGVWSFWKAILTETDRFVERLHTVPLTMDEWERQREICHVKKDKYSFELGFATFYMNRTNRSGIIKGGVIGGQEQSGKWRMDARFNRDELILRIKNIERHKATIKLYNKDINSFITNYIPKYEENAIAFFDPPYVRKGKQLYMNYFNLEDHMRIEEAIREQVKCDWIITYDNAPELKYIYKKHPLYLYDLNYSVFSKRKASELVIFSDNLKAPNDKKLQEAGIKINLRSC